MTNASFVMFKFWVGFRLWLSNLFLLHKRKTHWSFQTGEILATSYLLHLDLTLISLKSGIFVNTEISFPVYISLSFFFYNLTFYNLKLIIQHDPCLEITSVGSCARKEVYSGSSWLLLLMRNEVKKKNEVNRPLREALKKKKIEWVKCMLFSLRIEGIWDVRIFFGNFLSVCVCVYLGKVWRIGNFQQQYHKLRVQNNSFVHWNFKSV